MTLPSATSGAVKNFSWPPNSFLPATFLSQTISPLSRLMAMTRPSGRLAITRSSQSAMPRVRGALPSCFTPGSATQTNWPLFRIAGVDLVDRAPAVGGIHEAVVDERIDFVLRAVLPDVLHAAERHRPDHPQVLDVVAVDLRELRIARRAVVAVHQQPVLRLVHRVVEPILADGDLKPNVGPPRRGGPSSPLGGAAPRCAETSAVARRREPTEIKVREVIVIARYQIQPGFWRNAANGSFSGVIGGPKTMHFPTL